MLYSFYYKYPFYFTSAANVGNPKKTSCKSDIHSHVFSNSKQFHCPLCDFVIVIGSRSDTSNQTRARFTKTIYARNWFWGLNRAVLPNGGIPTGTKGGHLWASKAGFGVLLFHSESESYCLFPPPGLLDV